MIYDVTDLEVYRRSLDALNIVYELARQLRPINPKLSIQITSAAESVPSNIAEGFAKRKSAKEFMRFLEISMGSSDEVITRARSAKILGLRNPRIDNNLCDSIINEYKIISKQLNRLSRNWTDYTKRPAL